MTIRIGVMAEAPLPGRCLPRLLAAHSPEWIAGLYAAMLRDTLDGLQSVDASEYVVFAPAGDDVRAVLERHAPAPWQIVDGVADAALALARLGTDDAIAVLARSDAPSAPVDPLLEWLARAPAEPFVILGASDAGDAWLVGGRRLEPIAGDLPWASPELAATVRVRCRRSELPLEELPTAIVVDEPSAVLALFDELRRHPERAPRTAHFIVTR